MSGKKHLMRTVSVTGAVAAAAFPLAADAADPLPVETNDYSYFLSLEGGALFGESPFDKVGLNSGGSFDLDNFDDELGFRGAAAFGQQFENGWDWRVGVAVSRFMNNDASLSSGGGLFSGGGTDYRSDIDYETADLEIGFRPNHGGNFDLRMFAGLRFLHAEDSLDKVGSFSAGPFSIDSESESSTEFIGIGPRAGLDFATRMPDGIFGISGMIAGSAIFGRRDEREAFAFSICSGGGGGGCLININDQEDDEESQTILNLEAALGLDFHISDSSKITLGYRGEYWDSLIGAEDKIGGSSGGVSTDEDLLVHGPFLRFLSEF